MKIRMKLLTATLLVSVAAAHARELPLSDDAALKKARQVLSRLSLTNKVSLLAGDSTMYLNAIPEAGIPRRWAMSDCSHAIKPEHSRWEWAYDESVDNRSVVLPPLSALAMTWNPELAALHGHLMGEQMRARGKDQMLGPGVNINRTPLCGRNWEYLSEDPFLASKMVVPLVRAAQSHGIAVTVKHFCLNNQELNRNYNNAVCDERTLHEIYLPAFRAAIREGGALALMTSYNRVNGVYASENAYLQRGILRDRWGFRGMIVTDWGGQHSCVPAALNGGNCEMNRGRDIVHFVNPKEGTMPLVDAVLAGEVPESTVDEMALHVLWMMAKTGFLDGLQPKGEIMTEKHHRWCRMIGEEAITLLKNDDGVLPLKRKQIRRLVVLGLRADRKNTHRGGSCEAHAEYEITPFAGLREYLGAEAEVTLLPFDSEVAVSGRPLPIPASALETVDRSAGDAFVQRAWEVRSWAADKTWSSDSRLDGFTGYPVGRVAAATRYAAKVRATESGAYAFLVAATNTFGSVTVKVDGADVFASAKGLAKRIVLEKDRIYEVVIDVENCRCDRAFEFGWIPPSAFAATDKLKICREADAVIVFTGTTVGNGPAMEAEGTDLPDMREPEGHDAEIARLLKMNLRNLVIVNRSGTQLEMPLANACRTLLQLPYLGQEAGRPFARVIFGEVNPSGKLACTWPVSYADTAVARAGTYAAERSSYNERFYVGYRWFDKRNVKPLFPFGYGLGYTTFRYLEDQLKVEAAPLSWQVTIPVVNTGSVAGKETVQLYVKAQRPSVERCVKELKGFAKTGLLKPGEGEKVTIGIGVRDLAYYDPFIHRWRADRGRYTLMLGSSSADIRTAVDVELDGDLVFDDRD